MKRTVGAPVPRREEGPGNCVVVRGQLGLGVALQDRVAGGHRRELASIELVTIPASPTLPIANPTIRWMCPGLGALDRWFPTTVGGGRG
jgi:hypothetical protein